MVGKIEAPGRAEEAVLLPGRKLRERRRLPTEVDPIDVAAVVAAVGREVRMLSPAAQTEDQIRENLVADRRANETYPQRLETRVAVAGLGLLPLELPSEWSRLPPDGECVPSEVAHCTWCHDRRRIEIVGPPVLAQQAVLDESRRGALDARGDADCRRGHAVLVGGAALRAHAERVRDLLGRAHRGVDEQKALDGLEVRLEVDFGVQATRLGVLCVAHGVQRRRPRNLEPRAFPEEADTRP